MTRAVVVLALAAATLAGCVSFQPDRWPCHRQACDWEPINQRPMEVVP